MTTPLINLVTHIIMYLQMIVKKPRFVLPREAVPSNLLFEGNGLPIYARR